MSLKPAVIHLNGRQGHAAAIRRDDDYDHPITFEEDNGTPISKLGYVFKAQLKRTLEDEIPVASFTTTLTGAGNNVVRIKMTAAQTLAIPPGQYAWDLQEVSPGGAKVTRVAGRALVNRDVSQ